MKKVDLDKEYDLFLEKNHDNLQNKFNENYDFDSFVDAKWREYQDINALIDESNNNIDEMINDERA